MEKKKRQPFYFSLGLSLFLLLTTAGLLTVDYQGRRLSFGDTDLPLQTAQRPGGRTALQIKAMGAEGEIDITGLEKIYHFLLDFSCIPHR